ncbi:MAG TPA: ATP-binding cassette domain-containing protein [Dehalococcoidia bacterium]|jgi:cobalt/nickel transport system ATP-binding protein|nr:ATP-binding cassette domain-containing protein [Dehalococcoidia bacterium]
MFAQRAIEIENLHFSYPDGRQALEGISLSVGRGETVALIGPNGAGKSTLLLHLNGILQGRGTVRILGTVVEDKSLRWVRSQVGLVFQDPEDQLFSPTVFDDVAFGPINMGYCEDEVRRRVSQALEWVGMAGSEERSPHHLSLGEKKRIAIATVLSMSPEILAIDEPSSNLDPQGKWDLVELLRGRPETKVIASHDLELVQALCPRSIIIDGGRLVADDATLNIMSNIPLLQAHGLAPRRISVPAARA